MLVRVDFKRNSRQRRTSPETAGTVLLEVILALVLFVAAATVIVVGLNASVDSVDRLRLKAHATDLAVTVMSELQLGTRLPENAGPEAFPGVFTNWTWEVSSIPVDETAGQGRFARIEVVVRHDNPGMVHRLCQIIKVGTPQIGTEPLP